MPEPRTHWIETPRQRILQRLGALNTEFSNHETRLRSLAENFQPRRARWNKSDFNRGEDLNAFIINNAPLVAVRVAASGLLASIAHPIREWFRQTVADPDLADWGPVRQHLHARTQRVRAAMALGSFYQGLADGIFPDTLVFGFTAALLEEHPTRLGLLLPQMMGEYRLAANEQDEIDTIYRCLPMTVRQVVRKFAVRPDKSIDRSVLSSVVKNLWDRGTYDAVLEVINVIQPNEELEPGRLGWRGKPFASKWLEKGAEREDLWLRQAGYDEFPVLAPRWSARSGEAYGRGLAEECLGDAKELQHEEKRTGLMLDKIVNPPMVADEQTRGQRHSLVSGDVTYEPRGQGEGFRPAMKISGAELAAAKDHILRTQDRLDRGMMVDLFIRLLQDTRAQRATATEIDELTQQTALQLGPVLERFNPELLKRAVDWYDHMLERRGLMPPAPPELEGEIVKPEFISIMHQAQKGVGLGPLRVFIQEAAIAAQTLGPSIIDNIDGDEYVGQLAEMTGVAPSLLLSDEDVAAIRGARAHREQATEAQQTALTLAKVGKDVGTTPVASPGNALGAVLGASSPAQATGAALTPLGPLASAGFPQGGAAA